MFELKKVRYKSILTVDELSIKEGEITALIGQSGGGKSTLLKLLNKMLTPSEGIILYKGEPLDNVSSVMHRRAVLYLNQVPYIFPGTIKDNLIKGFMYQKREVPSDQALEAMLERVYLTLPLDASASTLSGGEAQRLALARILVLDAAVYLFDEPSSALDEESEWAVLDSVIDWLQRLKKTVVMVTHSKNVAKKHANRIYVMKNGLIEEAKINE